jgi:hypothetical protein
MPQPQTKPESIGRSQAINFLRAELLKRMDGDTSACRFAATEGIFCRGFARFGDDELRRRFAWITNRRPDMSRQELEEVVDRWQLARQDVDELLIACDVQQREHDLCHGWDDFSNEELSSSYFELTGQKIVVV